MITERPERAEALQAPPVRGRWYDVPTARGWWGRWYAEWPVLGPVHHDREWFSFQARHSHVDARFVRVRGGCVAQGGWSLEVAVGPQWAGRGGSQARREVDAADADLWGGDVRELFMMAANVPVCAQEDRRDSGSGTVVEGRRVMRCVRAPRPRDLARLRERTRQAESWCRMRAHYAGTECPERGGVRYCPHRAAPLSGLARGVDGVVVCRLHGLAVDTRTWKVLG